MAQPTGPRGRLPKNLLTPGRVTTSHSTATDTSEASTTTLSRPPPATVWKSWADTSATSPIVSARPRVPVSRPTSQAAVAALAVTTARR